VTQDIVFLSHYIFEDTGKSPWRTMQKSTEKQAGNPALPRKHVVCPCLEKHSDVKIFTLFFLPHISWNMLKYLTGT